MRSRQKPVIVADENISHIELLCGDWARVISLPGRAISRHDVQLADALLVRSVTPVDEELLADSRVRFVGTATIGTDHIDCNYLKQQNISFAYAPGCNANAVVDYVMSAVLQTTTAEQLASSVVGVVGYGNVGRRLVACLDRYGIQCNVYDPLVEVPIQYAVKHFDDVLSADIVSLHVPLTERGQYATRHLLAESELQALEPNTLLINSSRGAVVDNRALARILQQRDDLRVALDVWEGEPGIDTRLLSQVSFATPHIAGYSHDGKLRGSYDIVSALIQSFKLEQNIDIDFASSTDIACYTTLLQYKTQLQQICDLGVQTRDFRQKMAAANTAEELASVFDQCRKNYKLRDEFDYYPLLESAH